MTEIYYIPGADNHYKFKHDVVVLDERLKNYPKAHEHIKSHELSHAKNNGLIHNLKIEFRSDMEFYFGSSEEVQGVRQYVKENSEDAPLKFHIIGILRNIWVASIGPIGTVYQRIKRVI